MRESGRRRPSRCSRPPFLGDHRPCILRQTARAASAPVATRYRLSSGPTRRCRSGARTAGSWPGCSSLRRASTAPLRTTGQAGRPRDDANTGRDSPTPIPRRCHACRVGPTGWAACYRPGVHGSPKPGELLRGDRGVSRVSPGPLSVEQAAASVSRPKRGHSTATGSRPVIRPLELSSHAIVTCRRTHYTSLPRAGAATRVRVGF